MQKGTADSDEEGGPEEEDEEARGVRWGTSKRAYYDADAADDSEDEEAPKEEEKEARRLQREAAAALRPEDLGLSSDDEEEEEEEDDDDEEEALETAAAKGRGSRGGVEVEATRRDASALTDEERLSAVMSDAPELLALLEELQQGLAEVRGRVGPALQSVRAGDLGTAEGVSYLEAKHLLLLSYCTHIVFYLLLKAEGRPVRDHPVIGRLVQIRFYLEKVRPIDRRLQYQMDKLVALAQRAQQQEEEAAAAGGAEGDNPLQFKPRPGQLVAGSGAAGAEGGAYRPPKLNPVSMDGPEDREGKSARERRREKEMRRRAAQSDLVRELAAEITGAPEEVRTGPAGLESSGALKVRAKLAAREAVEEDLMLRVPISKEERKKLRREHRKGMAGAGLLAEFADDVADVVDQAEVGALGGARGAKGGIDPLFLQRQGISAKFGVDLEEGRGRKQRGGDDDLPAREPLADRRAKMDSKRARDAARMEAEAGEAAQVGEEDEFYRSVKEGKRAKRQRREEDFEVPNFPPLADPEAQLEGRRIPTEILKNRGLTPHRNRELKNPRKKNRLRFEKALVRRKGQVQAVKANDGAYGGETTGIRAKVTKSTRF